MFKCADLALWDASEYLTDEAKKDVNYLKWSVDNSPQATSVVNIATPKKYVVKAELKDDPGCVQSIDPRGAQGNIGASGIAWIVAHVSEQDPAPRMPQLELRALGLPENLTLHAKFEVSYVRGNGAKPQLNQPEDTVRLPNDGNYLQVSGDTWHIWQDFQNEPFFGGDAIVTYKVMDGATQVLSPQEIGFRIGGENPTDERCRAYIEAQQDADANGNLWFAYAIARHESAGYNGAASRYNQFLDIQHHNAETAGTPVWHDDDRHDPLQPGGYGIFQVTLDTRQAGVDHPIPRSAIWNWQGNVQEALRILRAKRQEADQWMQGQRTQAGNTPLPVHTSGNVTFDDQTNRVMEDAVTMKLYNSANKPRLFTQTDNGPVSTGFVLDPYSSGHYCYWRTHERVQNGGDPLVSNGIVQQVENPSWALSRINFQGFNYVTLVCNQVQQ